MRTLLTIAGILLVPATWWFLGPVHYGGPMNFPDLRPLALFPVCLFALAIAFALAMRARRGRALGRGLLAVFALGALTAALRLGTMPSDEELDRTSDWPPSLAAVEAAAVFLALVGLCGVSAVRRNARAS